MAKKRWRIVVTFPELRAAHAQQEATIEAGTLAVACARALREIRKRPGIKGRRYTTVTLQVARLPYLDLKDYQLSPEEREAPQPKAPEFFPLRRTSCKHRIKSAARNS